MTRPVAWWSHEPSELLAELEAAPTPGAQVLGFVPLPPSMLAAIAAVTLAYVGATEGLKRGFHRRAEATAGGAR